MLMVLVSLLTTLILGLVLLILVHYAIVSWEQDRVNNLSKQIRSEPTEDNILSRPTSSHKFTNVDLKTSLRWSGEVKSIKQTASHWYSKTITLIQTQDYAGWWQTIKVELEKLKKDWWSTLKSWWSYLLHLAQPITTDTNSNKNQILKDEKQTQEIAEVVNKIKKSSETGVNKPININQMDDASNAVEVVSPIADSPKLVVTEKAKTTNETTSKPVQNEEIATLNLATANHSHLTKDKDDSNFERLERKILDRLQESGLRDYNIWLQLGELYLKYDEPEKAKEIFALVLKQASGEAKEIARNHLLSL
jgi:hypothetical protein